MKIIRLGISKTGITQRAHQQQLPRCRLQQIRAAHYFGDPHCRVVDYDRKLVSRNIVASPDKEIAELTACDEALPAKIQVGKFHLLALGDAKPPLRAHWLHEHGPVPAIT